MATEEQSHCVRRIMAASDMYHVLDLDDATRELAGPDFHIALKAAFRKARRRFLSLPLPRKGCTRFIDDTGAFCDPVWFSSCVCVTPISAWRRMPVMLLKVRSELVGHHLSRAQVAEGGADRVGRF